MALKGLEGEELLHNLRQLIQSFIPHIRDAVSTEQAEEGLLHMEENDENFDRYEFVRLLKRKIDDILGPLIEEEIGLYSVAADSSTQDETRVSRIADRVIHSRQFDELKRHIKKNVVDAVDNILQNHDSQTSHQHQGNETSRQKGKYFITDEEDESSCGSSYNQESILFLKNEQIQPIIEKMSRTNTSEMKLDGMQHLNQMNPNDIISCENWSLLRKYLLEAFQEPDEDLSTQCLKFVIRSFNMTTPQTREVYTLLAEFLITQFHSRRPTIVKIKNGLDISKPDIIKLLRPLQLMNEFQREAPGYWIRYPEKYLEDILEKTLQLLAISPSGRSSYLTPVHFVALFDSKAHWFNRWMHGSYSRIPLLERLSMKTYKPLIVNAVRHCLDFSSSRKVPFDVMSEMSDSLSRVNMSAEHRTFYTGPELDYVYFVHSVCLLGRLLCFSQGRELFPIKFQDSEEPISLRKLIVCLVQVIIDPGLHFQRSLNTQLDEYDPGVITTQVLKELCTSEKVCQICLCSDVIDELISPVSQFLDENNDHHLASENTLLQVADVLCMLASSTHGRRQLLYGEGKDIFTRTRSSAAHIIAQFTKKALLTELPLEMEARPSHAVIGAFLYLCRQLYNTCEGLLVLYHYNLHECIARVWRDANRAAEGAATPTPSDDSDASNATHLSETNPYEMLQWEETLRDNLLNFASSAKGILLLQQTGAMNECVSYMHARYEKKLQVSKCEKFGYGYMVTQVAATVPGMVALQNTGYIKALITELWSVLECGPSDAPVFSPKNWPLGPIDRTEHKHLIHLLNVLTAFPAVYEVFADKMLPDKSNYSFREIPSTFVELFDRIVIVDKPAKIHSLFNYEQSHAFGLRVLSVMVSCLDTCLLLQSKYKFQDVLLSAQADNCTDHGDDIIIDMCSVERNHILVKCYLVGGPSERITPPRTVDMSKPNPYPYTMISSYPVPREYTPTLAGRSATKQDYELMKFLNRNKNAADASSWLQECRTHFCKLLKNKPDLVKGVVLQQLLEDSLKILMKIDTEATFPLLQYSGSEGSDSALRGFILSPLQQLGIKTAVRYGIHLKVINSSSDAADSLTQLLKQCGYFLQQQRRKCNSDFSYLEKDYPGFDWFAATIFLMFNGNQKKSWDFLYHFSTLVSSGCLWMPRLHSSIHLPVSLMSSAIPPLFSSIAHSIELLLQIELPLVFSAFKMSGYTPAQICMHWLKQCFWNYLDWLDICHYVCVCILLGVDYQIYICVAILKHLQQDLMFHMQNQDIIIFLKEEPIHGFQVSKNLPYMTTLEKKFRRVVLSDVTNIGKP